MYILYSNSQFTIYEQISHKRKKSVMNRKHISPILYAVYTGIRHSDIHPDLFS